MAAVGLKSEKLEKINRKSLLNFAKHFKGHNIQNYFIFNLMPTIKKSEEFVEFKVNIFDLPQYN